MGIFDKAKDLIGQHNDTVDRGIDKAADAVNTRTGGQHGDQIDQGADALKNKLDEFGGGTPTAEPPANEPPTAPAVS